MLRPCFWLLGLTAFSHAGETGCGVLMSCSQSADSTQLGERIQPFIPTTFTALSQISRAVDADVMEKVAQAGGLRSVLVNHPKLFNVAKVGEVYVARRLHKGCGGGAKNNRHHHHRKGQHGEEWRCAKREKRTFVREPPPAVFDLFPTFFVPVEALTERIRETTVDDAGEKSGDMVRRCIEEHREFIDVVTLRDTGGEYGNGGETTEWSFVRLRPSLAEFADPDGEEAEDGKVPIDLLMEPYEVPDYEPYRVARLIPVVETFVPVSSEMRRAASPLLAEGRCLLHVLVSAPHIFEVVDKPVLSVRFLLDPRYKPAITHTRDEILRRLDEMKKSRVKNGLRVPIDRKKRRALLRQLQFSTNPIPYFDERVMAHALVDVLPLDGPLAFGHLTSLLPSDCLHCLPQSPRRIVLDNPHLFRKLDGECDLLVQRADLPAPEERDLSSIGSEEIILLLYNHYPRRRHPSCGTCLERCLYSMPLQVRHRLRELDFVEDVLRRHPDRVEVLDRFDDELMKPNKPVSFLYKFQMFRFVGHLQEELITRYETLCTKLGHDPDKTMRLL